MLEATAKVNVDDPEPGAAIDDGLKLTVTPEGCPLADNATAELNPPLTVVEIVELPLLPCATETELGEAEIVNAGVGAVVTVSVTVVVCVSPPPVPVTVIGYVPAVVPAATASVIVADPEPGAAIDDELKLTVTPEGCPLADNATAESNPPLTVVEIVELPLLPCTTETEAGDEKIANAGLVLVGASALISAAPFGLPQPVTRSKPVVAE